MNYKTLGNAIVVCCMLTGAALMAYVDIKKGDLAEAEKIEIPEQKQHKISACTKKIN